MNRVWRLAHAWMDAVKEAAPFDGSPDSLKSHQKLPKDLCKKAHQTIKKVTNDIEERFHFNTAISAVMELVNLMQTVPVPENNAAGESDAEIAALMRFSLETVVLLLSPIVPHFAEELWEAMGHSESVLLAQWPSYREEALVKEELLIVIQVNGKLRGRFSVPADTDEDAIKQAALADERAQSFYSGKPVKKVIVVKNKLVNIVV